MFSLHTAPVRFGAQIAYNADDLRAKLGVSQAEDVVKGIKGTENDLRRWADKDMYIEFRAEPSTDKYHRTTAYIFAMKKDGTWSDPETVSHKRMSVLKFEPLKLFFYRVASKANSLAELYSLRPLYGQSETGKGKPQKGHTGWL